MQIFRARFVVPVDAPPFEYGAVAIRDGRIGAVGNWREIARSAEDEVVDFGDAVIFPGFVNAHTHLELTNLAGRVPPTPDFPDWIWRLARLIAVEANAQDQVETAVREGVRQSLAVGVTTIGDIARRPQWSRAALSQTSIRAVSYGEVIAVGMIRGRLDAAIAGACSGEYESDFLRVGLSPHSPYTVEMNGLRECAREANKGPTPRPSPLPLSLEGRGVDDSGSSESSAMGRTNPPLSPLGKGGGCDPPLGKRGSKSIAPLPLCIHLAETMEEERFTLHGDGPVAELLKTLGVWDEHVPIPRMRPVESAMHCRLLTTRTLLAHANYVSDEDIQLVAKSGASVAYCPRTHRAFGHSPHRFREMIAAGVNVCVGTDSLASNPSLSILDELRFLRENHSDVSSEIILAMGTLNGAKALGFEDECGSISVGKSADLVIMPLEHRAAPWDEVFHSNVEPVAVFVAGQRVEALDVDKVTPLRPPL